MWRLFHQIHHSPQRVDMSGAALFHPLETVAFLLIGALVTTLVLGLDPVAAALTGYIAAFYGYFQHMNIRTPQWLGYIIQRPEAHCIHHQRDVHAYNYGDLPVWDMLFGTFRNPAGFEGAVGFDQPATNRLGAMLAFVDVNEAAAGPGTPRAEVSVPDLGTLLRDRIASPETLYPTTKSKRPASHPSFLAVRTSNSLRNRPSERFFGLAGEIELGGQHAAVARLHLHMDVARAAGIKAGHDAAQPIAPFRIGELMAAQAETGIVVAALVVGLPEIQQGAGERLAGAGEHEADQFDRLPGHARFKQFDSLRR